MHCVDKHYLLNKKYIKKQTAGLDKTGKYGKILQICQSEHINHTNATVQKLTVFALAFHLKVAAPSLNDDESRDAQN
jgi:hypothetical protein